MASSIQPSYLQRSSWLNYVSFGGLTSIGFSTALFYLARRNDGRIDELDSVQVLETLASACQLPKQLLPLLVVVRGRISCREPATCELNGAPAVMRELVEEEVYMKDHISGRTTQESFEIRRETEQREAVLEDTTGRLRLDDLSRAEGLPSVMELKQVFRPVDLFQGPLIHTVINIAFKGMVKHGVRITERYLPANSTVTIVGELVPDRVGATERNAAPPPAVLQDSSAAAGRIASGAGASTSGRSPAAMAVVAAGAEMLGQAAVAAGSAALEVLPYTLRMPPGGPFHVTTMTVPQMRAAFERTSRTLRVFAWGFGLLGAALVARKMALQVWRAREAHRAKRMMAEADAARRRKRQQAASAGADPAAEDGGGGGDGGAHEEDDDVRGPGACVVCLDRDADIVFSGCGHMGTCAACTANLNRCPICRVVSRPIRVYRP